MNQETDALIQGFLVDLKAHLSFKHKGSPPPPRLTALYFKDTVLSSRNLCFATGLLLACWLVLDKLLALYTFPFPSMKNEGDYSDLFWIALRTTQRRLYSWARCYFKGKEPPKWAICLPIMFPRSTQYQLNNSHRIFATRDVTLLPCF